MIISRLAVIFGEPGNKFQENLKILSYFAKNILTNRLRYNIIIKPCRMTRLTYGGIAQLARAFGSYPECRWFESNCRYQFWPGGQEVKTPPFHGGNTSSILVRVTKYICRCGGIGRHKGLKIPRSLRPYRFKSGHRHQKTATRAVFFVSVIF